MFCFKLYLWLFQVAYIGFKRIEGIKGRFDLSQKTDGLFVARWGESYV